MTILTRALFQGNGWGSKIYSFTTSAFAGTVNLNHRLIWEVNWDFVASGQYAIVDPNNVTSILYLSKLQYLQLTNVAMSKDTPVIVLATPSDTKPSDSEIKAPRPGSKIPPRQRQGAYFWRSALSDIRRTFWKWFNPELQALEVVRAKEARSYLPYGDKAPYPAATSPVIKIDKRPPFPLELLLGKWSGVLAHCLNFPMLQKGWLEVVPRLTTLMYRILKSQGPKGLALYMKTSMLLLQQYLAGSKVKHFQFGYAVKLKGGIPAWIPPKARQAIRMKSPRVIRFYMSLCYLYKAIDIPVSAMKCINSICAPPLVRTENVKNLFSQYALFLQTVFIPSIGGRRNIPQWKASSFLPVAAGPNGGPAILTAHEDFVLWKQERDKDSKLWNYLKVLDKALMANNIPYIEATFSQITGGALLPRVGNTARYWCIDPAKTALKVKPSKGSKLLDPMETWEIQESYNLLGTARMQSNLNSLRESKPVTLSRVTIFPEPGGKVRAVAIVDILTQRYMKFLHDDIFSILKNIRQDGTWDQGKLFTQLAETMRTTSGLTWSSLDISSATDMIPKELYTTLLTCLYKDTDWGVSSIDFAKSVIGILTDRDFNVTLSKGVEDDTDVDLDNFKIRYGRGQPMGALASFALLALWHHSFVQFSAWRLDMFSKNPSFYPVETYGVTGDDVVIAEHNHSRPIANSYLDVTRELGIPISLPKSFLSSNLFNFLSRTMYSGIEVSPASLREEFAIVDSPSRTSRVMRLAERGWIDLGANNWLAQAVKLYLYPAEYILFQRGIRDGTLSGLGQRAIISLLSPNARKLKALGFASYPIQGLLAAISGYTSLLGSGNSVRDGSFQLGKETPLRFILEQVRDELSNELDERRNEKRARARGLNKAISWLPMVLRGPMRWLFLPEAVKKPTMFAFSPPGMTSASKEEAKMKTTHIPFVGGELEPLMLEIQLLLDSLGNTALGPDWRNPFYFSLAQAMKKEARQSIDQGQLSSQEKRMLSLMMKLACVLPRGADGLLQQYSSILLRRYSE